MADNISLSILRQTSLSSEIATKEWTEENFLPISAPIDLDSLSDIYVLSDEVVYGLSTVVNPKLSAIAEAVKDEVAKLDELSGKLSSIGNASEEISALALSVSEISTVVENILTNDLSVLSNGLCLEISSTNEDLETLIDLITDELSNNINPKISSIADQVSAETQKLDSLSNVIYGIDSNLSAYAPISAHNELVSSYTTLESRVLSTENLIGDILSILQEINDTEGE